MSYITQINKTSIAAAKLASAVNISIAGDATGTASFDGSAATSITVTLANNATARSNLGLGTVATLNTGTSSGNVPVLDANGKLATSVIPALALTDVFVKTDIVGATEAAAKAAMETWVLSLDAQVGDVAVYTYSWPETAPYTGSISGTLIKSKESSPSVIGDWTPISTPTQAQLDALASKVNAHIGSTGTTAHGVATSSAAGFLPALSGTATNVFTGAGTYVDHIGLGGSVHATATTSAAGFMPALDATGQAANKFLNGSGSWIEHIGLGGSVHATATTSAAGFMPALSGSAGQYLNGAGSWANISEITAKTIIATTGATAGALTKVGDHYGVAKSATEVYAHGVVEYGTGQVVGKAVYVKDGTTPSVVYGDLSTATAGTYYHIGYVVDATHIEIAAAQNVYEIVA